MIKTITFCDFCDSFSDSYKDNFTYNGKRALFDYLEQYEEDTGTQIELDTVALCCEYTEYADIEEYNQQYATPVTSIEDIQDYTTVIPIEGTEGFIIADY